MVSCSLQHGLDAAGLRRPVWTQRPVRNHCERPGPAGRPAAADRCRALDSRALGVVLCACARPPTTSPLATLHLGEGRRSRAGSQILHNRAVLCALRRQYYWPLTMDSFWGIFGSVYILLGADQLGEYVLLVAHPIHSLFSSFFCVFLPNIVQQQYSLSLSLSAWDSTHTHTVRLHLGF